MKLEKKLGLGMLLQSSECTTKLGIDLQFGLNPI